MILTLKYDAYNGIAFRDGDCAVFVQETVERLKYNDVSLVFGSENILTMFRVYIRRKIIDYRNVTILYKDQIIRVYPSAGLSPWPKGFCDFTEDCLMELL